MWTLQDDVHAQWQQVWHVKNLQAGVFAVTFPSQAELRYPSNFLNHIVSLAGVLSKTINLK